MKKFVISAFEDWYGGLHGVREDFIAECETLLEAEEIARETSLEIIESFNIAEAANWEAEAEGEGLEPGTEDYDEYINACYEDDIQYFVKEITKETNESISELNDKVHALGIEDFIAEYCN